MIFHNADIPEELINASLEGKLVVFAGAGVSMQSPVCLPSFDALVEEIKNIVDPIKQLRDRRSEPNKTGGTTYTETPEQYLSYLDSNRNRMRSACASLVDPRGKTNDLHIALSRLFPDEAPKIVTTNFDDCFETAFASSAKPYNNFSSPALPLGDSFTGLIHLHGCFREPNSMVLTAEDYGQAYVTRGWASRFLVDLFKSHTVLFVGYSCGDSLVDYLTRSISEELQGRAFALCKANDSSEQWAMRGVLAIPYSDYDDLPPIIAKWADYVNLSITERAKEIRRIASTEALSAGDEECLIHSLTWRNDKDKQVLTREFTSRSTSLNHLIALDSRQLLSFLTKDSPDEAERTLLNWAVTTFAIGQYRELQEICTPLKDKLSAFFYDSLTMRLLYSDAPDDSIGAWITWLACASPRYHTRCMHYLIGLANKTASPDIVLAIAKMLLRVNLIQHDPIRTDANPVIAIPINEAYYKEEMLSCLNRHKKEIGEELFDYCFEQISFAYALQNKCWTITNAFDHISYSRSAVEEHEQDQHNDEACSILLDVARESIEKRFAGYAIKKCLSSKCNLLIRLGLWLKTKYKCDGEALAEIEQRGYLDNSYLHHEAFNLMKESYDKANQKQRDSFVAYLNKRYEDGTDEGLAYGCYNVCIWLQGKGNDRALRDLHDHILSTHPNFTPRKHPDLTHYFSITDYPGAKPLPRAQFTESNLISQVKSANSGWTMHDFAETMAVSAKHNPKEAQNILENLLKKNRNSDENKLCKMLLGAVEWCSPYVDSDTMVRILSRGAEQEDLLPKIIGVISSLTSQNPEALSRDQLEHLLKAMSNHIRHLLAAPQEVTFQNKTNWVLEGINNPAGQYIELLAKLDALSIEEKGECSPFSKNALVSLLPLDEYPETTGGSLIACFFKSLNRWMESDTRFEYEAARILKGGGWAIVPAWHGISYLGGLNERTWELTSSYWPSVFNGTIPLEKEYSKSLAYLYIYAAIQLKDNSKRINMLEVCSFESAELLRIALYEIEHWLATLSDNDQAAEWTEWLSPSFGYLCSEMKSGIEIIAECYGRWINEFPHLRRLLAKGIQKDCAAVETQTLFVRDKTLSDIALDANLSQSEKATLIAFLVNHSRSVFYAEDARKAFRALNLNELNDSQSKMLKDAFTRQGLTDILEKD